MNIYEFRDYRGAFGRLFEREKSLKRGAWSIAGLAKAVRIQPSYLTNVTHKRAHFSSDQIHAICEQLKIGGEEADFLVLLMEHERASHSGRKARLAAQVEQARKQNLRAEKFISAPEAKLIGEAQERYYLDPNAELLHLYLGIKGAATKVAEIARALSLPEETVAELLAFLQKANLVGIKGGKWQREKIRQHLPRESPLTRPAQLLKRMKSLEHIQKLSANQAYNFSATVTMSEESRLAIQARFLAFLKDCESAVKESEPEGVYQIQFDLFPWL